MRRLLVLLARSLRWPSSPGAGVRGGGAGARKWDTRVFAHVQAPGYPAYAFAHRNGRVYAGTYTNPQGDHERSRVFEWSRGGTLLRSWTVPGQRPRRGPRRPGRERRRHGRLVLLEKSTAR